MKRTYVFVVSFLISLSTLAQQQLTQTIRGTVVDVDSESSLFGVTIFIPGTDPIIGAVSDVNGVFRLQDVPVGRVSLQVNYLGYESQTLSNITITSGKEVILDIRLTESMIKLEEIVISANDTKGEPLNEMALLSARSISAEETSRYAGGFNDPSRIMSNFAGVTSTQDGSNDIIVRGNSPKYVQWRLEGIQITNPNHFADQSAVGGAVSTLNNNLLGSSDFYTGAFTAEYGDALSAVYDVKFRTGNNEKLETVLGVGLLGTDLTLEGPLKKGYGGSFLINYRYSTAALIGELGLVDINGIPRFQDAALKLVLPTKNIGTFSVFSLGGLSSFLFEDVKPDIWETPGNRSMRADITEDFDKGAHLLNTGINHTLQLTKNSFINSTFLYSTEGVDDKIFESRHIDIFDELGNFIRDSTISRRQNFTSNLQKTTFRIASSYHHKFNARNKIEAGTKYALFGYNFNQSQFTQEPSDRATLVDFNENIATLRNFISWKFRLTDDLTIVSGLHNMNVLFNNKSTLEPRVAVSWSLDTNSALKIGYGMHSNMESVHNYYTQVEQQDGSFREVNRDLGLLKSHHYVLGYERFLNKNLKANIELYYQDLYNLPVENDPNSFYSTINEGLEFTYVDLINAGTGRNYGIELTLERFFSGNYYYMVNTSIYESKYTPLDGQERNTRYNGNFLFNFLIGKEFTNLGKKGNKTFGLNAKVFFAGAQKIIPLLRDDTGNLAVNPENDQYWDYERAYESGLDNPYQIILSGSYKWNKPQASHELFLNLDNLTNTKGKLSEYYDAGESGSIGYLTQFGFFPNLMYRVYF